MSYENQNDYLPERNNDSLFSKRLKAGKKRTYFFDVKATRGQDYYITLTESKKRLYDEGYEKHKLFLYKEDFNKFIKALGEAIDFVKTELMPDFDFDAFNHDQEYIPSANENGANHDYENNHNYQPPTENYNATSNPEGHASDQDNW